MLWGKGDVNKAYSILAWGFLLALSPSLPPMERVSVIGVGVRAHTPAPDLIPFASILVTVVPPPHRVSEKDKGRRE